MSEMELFKLTLKDDAEPAVPTGAGYYESFLVCAQTERRAWLEVQAFLKGDHAEEEERRSWLKGAKLVTCQALGYPHDNVVEGVLMTSYYGQ